MIEAINLSKFYFGPGGKKKALDGVSAHFPDGTTALIGPNGSGKSTLMRMISTLEKPSSGSMMLDGTPIKGSLLKEYRSRIGYVAQDVRFVSGMRCTDALEYAGWVAGMSRPAYKARTKEVLEIVNLSEKARHKVRSLSGGQNRRLGIAAALMNDPSILIMDEPTAGLDPQSRLEVRDSLRGVSQGSTVIISTHLADDVVQLCNHVVALNQGKVRFEGKWGELYAAARQKSQVAESGDALELVLAHISSPTPTTPINKSERT